MKYTTKEMQNHKTTSITLEWADTKGTIHTITVPIDAAQEIIDTMPMTDVPFLVDRKGQKVLKIFPKDKN